MIRGRLLFLSLLLVVSLWGCTEKTRETLAPLPPPPPNGAGATTPRASGPVLGTPVTEPPAAVTRGHSNPVQSQSTTGPINGDITLNFVDADIREIARTILGSILKVTYTIDPNVHGTGTVQTASPVSRDQALMLLETVLAQNGASLTISDDVYRVTTNQAAALTTNLVGDQKAGTGTKLVQMRYAAAADLATVLQPFLPPGAKLTADLARNVLVISGDAATRASLEEVIHAFDIDLLADKSFALFPVNSGEPEQVANELTKVLMTGENGALANVVQVIPMNRVNAVLIVSTQPRYLEDVRRLFAVVDRVSAATVRTWHVYYVRNGESADLEYLLQRAFTPDRVTSTGISDTRRLGSTVPGLQISQAAGSGSMTSGTGTTSGQPTGGMTLAQSAPQQQQQPSPQQYGRSGAPSPSTTALSSGESTKKDTIRIIADSANNALLIYATPQEYDTIEAMLGKIDILPLQVQIDAVIAEVTLNDQLQYGLQFALKSGALSAILSQNSTSGTGLPLSMNFPGFVLAKSSSAIQYTLSALQAITKVRVLSAPQITVLDNETATLQVGDQVPYLTQTASILEGATTAGSPIVNSIAYQETGVILQVLPRVNSGGLVTLDIAQEVSEPIATTSSTINSPTFSDRVVKSRVVVQDGQTIGLAGLISDNDTRINGGIPYVKDVPVLGALFANQDNTRNRTELLVLLTPHVNYDQRGVRELTDDLRNRLWHAGLVPQQLDRLPPSGSADPNRHLRGEP